ncbi:hypothetical protein DBR33_09870 [Stenotrophomonas sp. HMWF022]|nr:hypothetical protein DBR33_09870 [Stenotrophomonas sp. HMWF022]
MHDVQRVLYHFLAGGHIPLRHQFGKLAGLGRVEEKIQPGGALGGAALPALAAAFGGRQLLARSGWPAWPAFLFIHG